jgi:hypothetical protein
MNCDDPHRSTSAVLKLNPLKPQAFGALFTFDQRVGHRGGESRGLTLSHLRVVEHSAARGVDVVLATVAVRANKLKEVLDASRVEATPIEHQGPAQCQQLPARLAHIDLRATSAQGHNRVDHTARFHPWRPHP